VAKLSILAGSTSQSVNVFIQDSSSTVGAGLAALVFNTTNLIAYYTFQGANATATAITLATLAAVNSAFSSGGFKEIDATNMKGIYRLDIPNAALAAAKGRAVTIMLSGAANMAPCVLEIELTGWDNQDAVRGGMTALPNANAAAAGGLWILGANAAATTTLVGVAASGATPATAALTLTGGVASTTGGGTASPAFIVTGGAGAASTNGAASGATITAGGTNTVASTADALTLTAKSNGNGLTLTHAGTGLDLNATTSGPLQVNATQINAVSTASVTAISANVGTTQPVNFTGTGASALAKVDCIDWVSGAIPAVNVTGVPLVDLKYTLGTISPAAAGSVGIDWAQVANKGSTVNLSATTVNLVNTLTTYTGNTVQTGDAYARLGAPAGASIAADIAEIEGETDGIAAIPTSNPTAAAIATAVWTDTTAGDFTTSTSPGKIIFTQLGGAFTTTSSSVFTVASLANAPTGGSAPTTTQIATAVWQDSTAGDFTAAGSVGKSLMNGVALGTGLTVNALTTNNDKAGYALSAMGLNSVLVDGKTVPAALQYIAASTAGKISGAGTGTETFLGVDGATTRLTITVDASGNRSGVVYG
jgi:hypothetical protein